MNQAVVAVLLFFLINDVIRAELPSSCLTSITGSNSVECCQLQPFLEISFKLNFECSIIEYIDQGIRLEVHTSENSWQPVRFYAVSMSETDDSVVKHLGNNMVFAEALTYSSNFSLEIVPGDRSVLIREYICDPSFTEGGNISVRWLQRYGGTLIEGEASWSLDDIVLTVWNGNCRREVLRSNFDQSNLSGVYDVHAGSVDSLPCNVTGNRQLYFNAPDHHSIISRRSLTVLRDVSLSGVCPQVSILTSGMCNTSGCDVGRSVCSIGALNCTGCNNGYYLPHSETTLGVCQAYCDELPIPSNASITYNNINYSVGTVATYNCTINGYSLVGNKTRTCQTSGMWSESAPACEVDCGQPPPISNGEPATPSSTTLGSEVNYTCHKNFEVSGTPKIVCLENGLWSNLPSCTTYCDELLVPSNASITYDNFNYSVGTVATYNCIINGYSLVGNKTRTCQTSGMWSESAPACEVDCGQPPPILNGEPATPSSTTLGSEVNYTCHKNFEVSGTPKIVCLENGLWSNLPNCTTTSLDSIFKQNITEDNYDEVVSGVDLFTSESVSNTTLQTPELVTNISQVFNEVAGLVKSSSPSSNPLVIQPEVIESMASTLNSLIQWNPELLQQETVSSILESHEIVTSFYAQGTTKSTLMLDEVSIVTVMRDVRDFKRTGSMIDFINSTTVQATISLPYQLFKKLPNKNSTVGILYSIYENSTLFSVHANREEESTLRPIVATPVIAATVGFGINFTNVYPPIVIALGLNNEFENAMMRENSERCVSWNFSSDRWVTDGCVTIRNKTTDAVECHCTHLTNFAVLIDVCTRVQDCESNLLVSEILSVTTYIGVILSCFGIIITIITLLSFVELRHRDNTPQHIQLCIAIFCMLVVFAVGIERTEPYAGCVVVSVLIHYFSLVAVMWMGAEAVLMFRKLVIIFGEISTTYHVVASLICWLLPLIPVVLVLIVDMTNGSDLESDLIVTRYEHGEKNTSGFCFLKDPGVFFGAFLAPIFVIILVNVVILIWVTVIVVRSTKDKLNRTNENLSPKAVIRLIIGLFGISCLFGITWVFAALTVTISGNYGLRTTFQTLFVISATFQGFFLFLFFCLLDQKSRDSWKEAFTSCIRVIKNSNETYSSSFDGTALKKTYITTLDSNSCPYKESFSELKMCESLVIGDDIAVSNAVHKTRVIITVEEASGTE